MRLYPVATFLTRIIQDQCVIGGYNIPPEVINTFPSLMHNVWIYFKLFWLNRLLCSCQPSRLEEMSATFGMRRILCQNDGIDMGRRIVWTWWWTLLRLYLSDTADAAVSAAVWRNLRCTFYYTKYVTFKQSNLRRS